MAFTDDPRKTLYNAFTAYSGANGGIPSSDAVGALDCIFDSVVRSMTREVRERFVSSLESGSTAIESIDDLLHHQQVAKQQAAAEGIKEEGVLEQAVIESEVIKLLQQLPREKRSATEKDGGKDPIEIDQDAADHSSSSRKETSVSGENGATKQETDRKGNRSGTRDYSKNEFYAAQALLQSHRGGTAKRSRQYSDPVPSEHCHVCCRPTRKLRFAVCSNIKRSLCRKVICVKCFESFEWDWLHASETDTTWICTHCREECPKRAQCYVYERINSRRKRKNRGEAGTPMNCGPPEIKAGGAGDSRRRNGPLGPPSLLTNKAKEVSSTEGKSEVRVHQTEGRN